nr:type VI secretion system baseplate subunit TssG [Burkholderia guangdongensis]
MQVLSPRRTFFELMRRIEMLERERNGSSRFVRRSPGWLRIEQSADMGFASTEISRIDVRQRRGIDHRDGPRVSVIQRHFGLFAPYGPMPLSVTEHAMHERNVERNPAFERFVNLVCGDLAWMHYLAWSSMHPVLGCERGRNAFVERVTSFANARQDAAVARDAMACRHAFPGAYCARRRSLVDLQRVLGAYFHVPLKVVPRHGRWVSVMHATGARRRVGTWRLGARIWDVQYSMEIVIGPLAAGEFHRWQRRAPAVMAVCAVASDFVDGAVDPVIKVQVRTCPELAGRIGRMRIGVDAWSRPNHALRTLTVHESFRGDA